MIYIYTLADPNTNEIRYIGKTNNPKRRYYQYTSINFQNRQKSYVSNWVKSLLNNGQKPIMDIIESVDNNWQEREIYWISEYKRLNYRLCNITKGGDADTSEYLSKPVSIYDKEGNYVRSFKSATQCSEYLQVTHRAVISGAQGVARLIKDYQIKYGESTEKIEPWAGRKERIDALPILQLDKDSNIIAEYSSSLAASKITGYDRANIIVCLKNPQRTSMGFKWQYKT